MNTPPAAYSPAVDNGLVRELATQIDRFDLTSATAPEILSDFKEEIVLLEPCHHDSMPGRQIEFQLL
ncbi:MAG: hypothetical protein WC271_15740 [Bacteroidales bacterium]